MRIFFTACRNCRLPTTDGTLCRICLSKPECDRCHRRLERHSFANSSTTCNACLNKQLPRRSALEDRIQEIEIPLQG